MHQEGSGSSDPRCCLTRLQEVTVSTRLHTQMMGPPFLPSLHWQTCQPITPEIQNHSCIGVHTKLCALILQSSLEM